MAILMRIWGGKSIRGWPLVVAGWIGSGLVILVTTLMRPEIDMEMAILAVTPVLFIVTAVPLLSKKYGRKSEPRK